jgi:hypothetical protein
MFFLCESYILRNLYHLRMLLCFLYITLYTNFCKIKCYVNTFNKRKSIKVIAYRYSTIIYWTKKTSMGISFLKKKRFSPFERRFPYLLLWNFSDRTGWKIKILRGAWNAWHKNSGYRGVCFLSVYLFSVALMRIKIVVCSYEKQASPARSPGEISPCARIWRLYPTWPEWIFSADFDHIRIELRSK